MSLVIQVIKPSPLLSGKLRLIFKFCAEVNRSGVDPGVMNLCRRTTKTMHELIITNQNKQRSDIIYESRDTPLEFRLHQSFFTRNEETLLYQEIQI